MTSETSSTARQALDRLRAGNRRYVADQRSATTTPAERRSSVAGQEPFAIILGCSDSRVPAELVFDQGLGDLFVVRVAGNIAAPTQVGSIEFAAEVFGTRLVVVLGHTGCGAVQATVGELDSPSNSLSPDLGSIVEQIRPAVEPLHAGDLANDREALIEASIRANVRAAVDHLRQGSQVLQRLINDDGLHVVGAQYSLESGEVEFFDDVPA